MNTWGIGYFYAILFALGGLMSFASLDSNGFTMPTVNDTFKKREFWLVVIICIFIIIAVCYYFAMVMRLKEAWLRGLRNQQKCGNEFLEVDTANYALYMQQQSENGKAATATTLLSVAIILNIIGIFAIVYSVMGYTSTKKKVLLVTLGGFTLLSLGFGIAFIVEEFTKAGSYYRSKASVFTPMSTVIVGFIISILCVVLEWDTDYNASTMSMYVYGLIALSCLCMGLISVTMSTGLDDASTAYKDIASTPLQNCINTLSNISGANYGMLKGVKFPSTADTTQYDFCRYLMSNIQSSLGREPSSADAAWATMWPYFLHQKNGLELQNLLNDLDDSITDTSNCDKIGAITRYFTSNNYIKKCVAEACPKENVESGVQQCEATSTRNTGKSPGTTPHKCSDKKPERDYVCTTNGVREILSKLRSFTAFGDALNSASMSAQAIFCIMMFILFFPVFHKLYTKNEQYTSMLVGLCIILLFLVGGLIGWINMVV